MILQELYARYGELMVQQEILTGQINNIKQQLANELNKEKTVENVKN